MFPDPFSMFWPFFVLVAIVIVVSIILSIFRAIRSTEDNMEQPPTQNQTTIKEREIIREIIKIRCPYCGNTYEEKENVCPYCGARRP